MRRTHLDQERVRFERSETDDRTHAAWVLEALVAPSPSGGTSVTVDLHYGGALWSTPIEAALSTFEGGAAERLDAYLAQ